MKKLTAPFRVMQTIARLSPKYFVYFLPEIVFSSFLPLLTVYVPKLIIEALTSGESYRRILIIILWYSTGLLFLNITTGYLSKRSNYEIEKFSANLSREIGTTVMRLELSELETTTEQDNIRLAGNARETIGLCEVIKRFITSFITLVGYAVIISKLDVRFLLIVAMLIAVKGLFTAIRFRYSTKMLQLHAENNRIGDYLNTLCYFNQGAAKELRVNFLQGWFLDKVKSYRKKMVSLHLNGFRMDFIFDCINAVLLAISTLYILLSLANYYKFGQITIADFTLYFSTVTATIALMGAIAELISTYNRQLRQAADFERLQNLAMKQTENKTVTSSTLPDSIELEFHGVSFTYPGSETSALKNINIKIHNREKLVIVGYNGAGKSTFIKLLCKFYRPTEGVITLNGVDIQDIPNEQYYRLIGAVFQDYATLAFTIRENVTMGDSGNIYPALQEAGIDNFVRNLPNKEDTYISKKYSDSGVELSGGQSQKIALARALYKNAPILLLDEPTASFDTKAESELYERFFTTSVDKTAIFISHRLAASHVADRIAVFSNGEMVECGTHKDLMATGGIYSEMFEKQRKGYYSQTL